MEKQGTKLYGIAPIPFFAWLLKMELATLDPNTLDGEEATIDGFKEWCEQAKDRGTAIEEKYNLSCVVGSCTPKEGYNCLSYNTKIGPGGYGFGYNEGYYIITPDEQVIFLD